MREDFFNDQPEGEWDDRSDLVWNEFDWERYLKETGDDEGRFEKFYIESFAKPTRLDDAAQKMGWEVGDWNDNIPLQANLGENEEENDISEPYTLYKHPLHIASEALFTILERHFAAWVKFDQKKISLEYVLMCKDAISQTRLRCLRALASLDVGETMLAVAELKRALHSLMSLHQVVSTPQKTPGQELFLESTMPVLFDLRELWLRVMRDCREEFDRGGSEQ